MNSTVSLVPIEAPGIYVTRGGANVAIKRRHPYGRGRWVSDQFTEHANPGAWWWDTGKHPFDNDLDLVGRFEEQAAMKESA